MASKYKGTDLPETLSFAEKVAYYAKRLSDRTIQMFDYKNLPPTMNRRDLEFQTQQGYSILARAPNGDLYSFSGGLGGEPSVYYHPTVATIANPALSWSANLKIDDECVVIWNDDFRQGLTRLNQEFARMLAVIDDSIECRSLHARTATVFTCDDAQSLESGKKYFDKLFKTDSYSIISTRPLLDNIKSIPNENIGLIDLIEARQYVYATWKHEVGLSSVANMKRERLTDDEVQVEQEDLEPICDSMLNQRKIGIEKVNRMFGTNITVDFSSAWKKEIKEGGRT